MNRTIILIIFVLSVTTHALDQFQSEFIFPLQNKHVHSSSIVQLPNGDFLACWFYGSGERTANDVKVMGARLKKGASTWSPVFEMADTYNLPDCNPVLFVDRNKKLWMFWVAVQAARWERSVLKYRTSVNYMNEGTPEWNWQDVILLQPGKAFEEEVRAKMEELNRDSGMWAEYALPYQRLILEAAQDPVKRQTGWMTRTHPIQLREGRILVPLYSDGFNICLMAISDDDGITWRASKPIVGFAPIQPSVVEKADGTLVAYMRDSGDAPGRALIATSADRGESWSAAVDSDIPNPGSSLEVIALKNGSWVMVFNDTENGRHQLAIALSQDEGETWPWKKYLARSDPGKGSYAYPSVIQADDGKIHVTFSWRTSETQKSIRHAVVTEDWIKQ